MKKTTFVYSFCGCFLTSVAVATTLYLDVNPNSSCNRWCSINPSAGQCCPNSSNVSQISVTPYSSSSKIFEGLYFNGIKLFEYDGTVRDLSSSELLSIQGASSGGTTPTLVKKQYNHGTVFVSFDENGEFTEYTEPQRGAGYCDHTKIILHQDFNDTGSGGIDRTIYYKQGVGYFEDPARTIPYNINNDTALKTRSGYVLRGFFTTTAHWDTTTDTSSYINNLSPYRTIGHAYIPWEHDFVDSPGSGNSLKMPSTDTAFPANGCPEDNGDSNSYIGTTVQLYAGWAKNCADTEHCKVTITGFDGWDTNAIRVPAPPHDKIQVHGKWLPGAVEYELKDACNGTKTGTTLSPLKYYNTYDATLQFSLGTYALGCNAAPQNYTVDFTETWDTYTYSGQTYTSTWDCDPVQSQTCTSGGNVAMPTDPACSYNPTKSSTNASGYEFNSWFNSKDKFLNSNSTQRFACNGTGDFGVQPDAGTNTITELKSFACRKYSNATNAASISLDSSLARYCLYTVTCNSGYHCAGTTNDTTCYPGCRAFQSGLFNSPNQQYAHHTGRTFEACHDTSNFDIDSVCVSNGGSGSGNVTVQLDTRGGDMSGSTTISIARGGNLGAYVPDRSGYDGAIFAGWALSTEPDSAANKNAVVNAEAGSTVSYRAVYTCPSGRNMNTYGVCVSDDDEYLDTSGGGVQPGQLNCWRPTGTNGSYENYCYWKVNVTFHDKPTATINVPGINSGNDGLVLDCEGAGCKVASGSSKYCCTPDSGSWANNIPPTCNTGVGVLCQSISTPSATGYEFRGYFWNNSPVIVTEVNDTTWSAFSNFFPKNLNNRTISVVGHAVVVMSESVVPIVCIGNWVTGPNGNTYCNGNQTTQTYSLDVYGGWARDCASATQQNPSQCNLVIGNNWNISNGLRKGNVRYDTSCDDGWSLVGGGSTYNPECEKQSGMINLTYQFVDQHGFAVSGCSVSSGTCEIHNTYYLPSLNVCGTGYTLKYLNTHKGLYTPNHPVTCSSNVFGDTEPRTVTGYVCRNTCTPGDYIPNGTCMQPNLYGGTVNDNEYVENIWTGCYAIQCLAGYKVTETANGIACVQQ